MEHITVPRKVQDSPSLSSFRYQLNSNLTKPPVHYTTGSRKDQINHTRIRTHCSALNQHLFSKKVILSPLCSRGGIENSRHFLLQCTLYHDIRLDMMTTILETCRPNLGILLYDSHDVSNDDNIAIFKAVQKFISKSKRFSYT